jgi:hypothetical protein
VEMIGAKVPPSWKELVKKLAQEKGLTESEVVRAVLGIGLKHMPEVNGKLHELAEEGEIIMKAKRALALRRTIGHFAGHQSGWRASAERIENPTVQTAYLEITENVQKEVMNFLKKRQRTKGKRTLLEFLWDTRCKGCIYRINRDKEFCKKNCQMYKKLKEGFKRAKKKK